MCAKKVKSKFDLKNIDPFFFETFLSVGCDDMDKFISVLYSLSTRINSTGPAFTNILNSLNKHDRSFQ